MTACDPYQPHVSLVIRMPFDLSDEQLEATETEIGAKFSESYRRRMMQCNGGKVDAMSDYWILIPFGDTSDRKRLSRTANHVLVDPKSVSGFPSWHERIRGREERNRRCTGDVFVRATRSSRRYSTGAMKRALWSWSRRISGLSRPTANGWEATVAPEKRDMCSFSQVVASAVELYTFLLDHQ